MILAEMKTQPHISITTDVWSSKFAKESFISLTAHYLDEEFDRHHAVLACAHFPGEHKGKNL